MEDQANGLAQTTTQPPVNVIAVTSGKGGVGKTNIAINLAVSLSRQGREVVLFDADLGLANVDVALGLKPSSNIEAVIAGDRNLESILVEGPEGIRIVPASSGVTHMTRLCTQQRAGLVRAFSELTVPVDTLIVDTGAGIDAGVLTFSSACESVIVVICDEPSSITDAYALIKVLNRECGVKSFQLLANMVGSEIQGRQLYGKLNRVAEKFLDVHLGYLGAIPRDVYLRKAVQQQCAVVDIYPRSESARALMKIASRIDVERKPFRSSGGLEFFVERLINPGTGVAEVL